VLNLFQGFRLRFINQNALGGGIDKRQAVEWLKGSQFICRKQRIFVARQHGFRPWKPKVDERILRRIPLKVRAMSAKIIH